MADSDLGTDFGGVNDLDAAWGSVDGRRALAESIARRLITPRGALPDFPDYGFDLVSCIGSAMTDSRIRQRVSEQVFLEEEIQNASVSIVRTNPYGNTALDITVSIDATGVPPFDLTLNVSALGVEAIIPKD